MARSVTVIVRTVDANPKIAGVEVNTSAVTWVKSESGGANHVFDTARGPYRVLGGSAFEMMRPGGGTRVGRFENFNPETVANGASGQGLSDHAGAITWRVEGIATI